METVLANMSKNIHILVTQFEAPCRSQHELLGMVKLNASRKLGPLSCCKMDAKKPRHPNHESFLTILPFFFIIDL